MRRLWPSGLMSRQARGTQTGRDPAGPGGLRRRIVRLEDENAALGEQQRQLGQEQERLRADNERLRAERERLQEINERLRGEGEALRRGAKPQAAPFSKGDPTPHPGALAVSRVRPTVATPTGPSPSRSPRSLRGGCRRAVPTAAVSWRWSGWRCSTSRTCRPPLRWWLAPSPRSAPP